MCCGPDALETHLTRPLNHVTLIYQAFREQYQFWEITVWTRNSNTMAFASAITPQSNQTTRVMTQQESLNLLLVEEEKRPTIVYVWFVKSSYK